MTLNGSLTRKRATGTEGGLRRTKDEYQARGERTEGGYGNRGRTVRAEEVLRKATKTGERGLHSGKEKEKQETRHGYY
jgi:hypothetical protein